MPNRIPVNLFPTAKPATPRDSEPREPKDALPSPLNRTYEYNGRVVVACTDCYPDRSLRAVLAGLVDTGWSQLACTSCGHIPFVRDLTPTGTG